MLLCFGDLIRTYGVGITEDTATGVGSELQYGLHEGTVKAKTTFCNWPTVKFTKISKGGVSLRDTVLDSWRHTNSETRSNS